MIGYLINSLGMVKENVTEVDGVVKEALPNMMFRVELIDGREILAHVSGKMRLHFIKILLGDRVRLEVTPYDEKRGRITYRYR